MSIFFEKQSKTFHLTNGLISYVMKVLSNDHLGQLYFGKAVNNRSNFDYLIEMVPRPMTAYVSDQNELLSLEQTKQEYPSYGSGDFRHPAVSIMQENGSFITDFKYTGHEIVTGKPKLEGLPATYCEYDSEAETLKIFMRDDLTGVEITLLYTLFADRPVIARSAYYKNTGEKAVTIDTAMSVSLDLPDDDYDLIQLSGAWARERYPITSHLRPGIQSVESTRGTSSHNHNPFIILKRPSTDEKNGEAIGFSLVYSGNFLAQAEVDSWNVTRVTMGINPFAFSWKLESGESFQTPEAVVAYTDSGLNSLSHTFHKLYQKRLAKGYWRDRPRPILINNWEATYFNFNEEKLLEIAKTAKNNGIELFVLDDGWFGARRHDRAGLGDWKPNTDILPDGITGLSEKIETLGLKFGLWFEPEMVNADSDLYRAHPDWIISTPDRQKSQGRNQFVLNMGRRDVVEYLYDCMSTLLRDAKISYIKWDMNRCVTEPYSNILPSDRQGEMMHRHILGVYELYERLTSEFPHVLFESCASGGGRFDPGILHYAPQGWASDDTDAYERLKIQYSTTLCYPVSCIGAHVSIVPNHQVLRTTPLKTRANVACFGTFGYEMDLNRLNEQELADVRAQVEFMKKYREIIQFGDFYRLQSPYENNYAAWMSVSEDKKTAVVGSYKIFNEPNCPFKRVKLEGLDPNTEYSVNGGEIHSGSELMNIGLVTTDSSSGEWKEGMEMTGDFYSKIFVLSAV